MDIKKLLWESKLAIALVLLIAARCVDRVIYTRITYDYTAFLWYFSNVILPISFIATSWPIVWYKMYFTNDITDEMRQFPHYKFAIMAFLDSLSILLSSFPTPHIGGNLANVLGQLNLPFNMVLAYMFLHTRFKRGHILGSTLVLYGGLVNMIPVLNGEASANMPDPTAGWITLYILSLVPAAAANVYKEMGLKDTDLDIWYTSGWVSFYQLLFGMASIWTVRIQAFSDPPVPWSEFPSYVRKAHSCFLGNAVELNDEALACDAGVFQIFLWFMLFNKVYNVLTLYIFKKGSSVLFVVSSAVGLPLTDLLYMIPALTGKFAGQQFTIYDGFALFVLVIGLLVYHSEKEVRQVGDVAFEKSPMYASPGLQNTRLMKHKSGKLVYRQSPNPLAKQRLLRRDSYGNKRTYGTSGAAATNATNAARNTSNNSNDSNA